MKPSASPARVIRWRGKEDYHMFKFVAVILGGVTGCVLAIAICWYGIGIDVAGLSIEVRKVWPEIVPPKLK